MSEETVFRVGSRKSELALIQTNCVIDAIKEVYPTRKFEIVTMDTVGDRVLDRPLPKIGEKSLFTKELEIALSEGRVDFVVHSLKDMPTALPQGLAIGAILKREDPRDAVVLHSKHRGLTLATLPEGSIIGTSSLRRAAQLRRKHTNLIVEDIRGNLQTRLKKLDSGAYDGIILAVAGVTRMGWDHRISQILNESEMLYAVGQGALGLECRADVCPDFAQFTHTETLLRTIAERTLLFTLGGGCSAPVAVSSTLSEETNTLELTAAVWSLDGKDMLQKTRTFDLKKCKEAAPNLICGISVNSYETDRISGAHELGLKVAQDLIDEGAMKIIETAKEIVHLNS